MRVLKIEEAKQVAGGTLSILCGVAKKSRASSHGTTSRRSSKVTSHRSSSSKTSRRGGSNSGCGC